MTKVVRLLFSSILTALMSLVVFIPATVIGTPAQAANCVSRGVNGQRCSDGSNSGGSTWLRGRDTRGNTSITPGDGGSANDGAGWEATVPPGRNPSRPSWIRHLCPDGKVYSDVACPETAPTEDVVEVRILTVDDIAAFSPQTPFAFSQPQGWTIRTRNTNFYVQAETHIVAGTLLAESADVMFAPVGYSWDYGDGTTFEGSEPGNAWGALGQGFFSATTTSHAYVVAGVYSASATVYYSAMYRLQGGVWNAIVGVVATPAAPLEINVLDARNVLATGVCQGGVRLRGC